MICIVALLLEILSGRCATIFGLALFQCIPAFADGLQARTCPAQYPPSTIVRSQSGDVYCIPVSYLKDGKLSRATPSVIWLEVVWPAMVGRRFSDTEKSRQIPFQLENEQILSIALNSGVPRGSYLFNRMVGEYDADEDPTLIIPADPSVPDDVLGKRIRVTVVDGLVTYKIDRERVWSKFSETSRVLDKFALAAYNDWHIRRSENGEIQTFIRCTTALIGESTDSADEAKILAPQCVHGMFLNERRDIYLELRYRRSMLNDWFAIERSVSNFVYGLRYN